MRAYTIFQTLFLILLMNACVFIEADKTQSDNQAFWPFGASTMRWFSYNNNDLSYQIPLSRSKALTKHMHFAMRRWLRHALLAPCEHNTASLVPTLITERATSYAVRVLLSQAPCCEQSAWCLQAQNGFIVRDPSGKERTLRSAAGRLRVTTHRGSLYLNDRPVASDVVHIIPIEGHTRFEEREYKGVFILARMDDVFYLMNSLDLEDYICGVLRTESWPGWSLEVNKVLAIACRSYAMSMILRRKYTKLPYHIRNTNYHQTYGGVHDNPIHRAAVEQTRGVFLAYEGQPILAMFDGCCGGIIPAHITGFNFRDVPYLAREYACDYCKTCKIYNWHAEYTVQEFLHKIKHKASLTKLKSITISKKDKAGLVKEVKLKGTGKHSASLTGKQVYSLFKEVKSFCFTITHQGDRVTLKGRGFGHHCGLCQWGACQMVHHGRDHKSILQYYYPGTTFMKLS